MEYRPKFPPRIWTWCISYEEWKKTYKPKEENLPFVPNDVDPSYVWSECWCDGLGTIDYATFFL